MSALAILAFLIMSVLGGSPARAQIPIDAPFVRTTLDPASGVVVGQPVKLHVEVLFPGEMPHPPLVRVPEAAGAQILRFETQAVTIRDRIADRDYVGQSFEFVLFPRRGGEIAIPPANITVLDRAGDPAGSAKGEATRISVTVPPGIDAAGPVLVTDVVEITQDWSPDPAAATIRAGGALVRTIHRKASGVPALGMAEFRFAAPEGVRVYPDTPTVDDRTNRGEVEGLRTDQVTYVFETAGTYTLPALSQPWWSLADRQARTQTLPGVTVTVAIGTAQPGTRPAWASIWLIATLAVSAGLIACISMRRMLGEAWRAWKTQHQSSEAFARKQLRKAAKTGQAAPTYRAFSTWLLHQPTKEAEQLRDDARIGPMIGTLENSLFGTGEDWNRGRGAVFAEAVRTWSARRDNASNRSNVLPPLNPLSSSA
ncbi:hypothetical protein B6S44_03210 [Bosea sp. Tri-44]|uniref:BatD family protein n=1 Tax=Bosea sp. Tri-44 TaxID=1972137 RepID=UPI00100DA1CB|nr:BatD family protein [Bosea sp. Tri-44]RXT57441.1 hypothetical protein B6S44_03210 [Bosea sp. Tri-44]